MPAAKKKRGRPKGSKTIRQEAPKGPPEIRDMPLEKRERIFEEKVRSLLWSKTNLMKLRQDVKEAAELCDVEIPNFFFDKLREPGCRPKEVKDMYWDGTPAVVWREQNNLRFIKINGKKCGWFRAYREGDFRKGMRLFVESMDNGRWKYVGKYNQRTGARYE